MAHQPSFFVQWHVGQLPPTTVTTAAQTQTCTSLLAVMARGCRLLSTEARRTATSLVYALCITPVTTAATAAAAAATTTARHTASREGTRRIVGLKTSHRHAVCMRHAPEITSPEIRESPRWKGNSNSERCMSALPWRLLQAYMCTATCQYLCDKCAANPSRYASALCGMIGPVLAFPQARWRSASSF